MTANQPDSRDYLRARLDLSSRDGQRYDVLLSTDESPEARLSATGTLPHDIWRRCKAWYEHLETRWLLSGDGLTCWQRTHSALEGEMANLMRAILLPGELQTRLGEQAHQRTGSLVLIEVRADHQHLGYLPLELIGQCEPAADFESVVWRGHPEPQERRPSLRFLVARSAPKTVSLPQSEEELGAIQRSVASRSGTGIQIEPLPNCTYDEFTGTGSSFLPGVVHMTMHGTSRDFIFNSPPTHDPVPHSTVARYFKRQPSVTTVVATACYSAKPSRPGDNGEPSFAHQLLDMDISAAIGMTTKITPYAAQVFAEHLYASLGAAQQISDAYAQAVLAIRNLREDDHLLWSIPVMYAKSNVIPFPSQEYLDLLDRLQDIMEGIECLRYQLSRLPAISQGRRGGHVVSLSVDMAAIRDDLGFLAATWLSPGRAISYWQKGLARLTSRLDYLMREVEGDMRQGREPDQAISLLIPALDDFEQLVRQRYPILTESDYRDHAAHR